MRPFKPTHRITESNGQQFDVMRDEDGSAVYTQAEWETNSPADHEVDDLGHWTFQGRPVTTKVERLYWLAIPSDTTGGWDVLEQFAASSDDNANYYAEATHPGEDWYVLDANGENING